MDRITDAFIFPLRDPRWLAKVALIALLLLIPIVGTINAVGWMLATLDRLRARNETLAPAGFGYLKRGIRLFVVEACYGLAVAVLTGVFYVPALVVFVHEGVGSADLSLVSLGFLLSLLAVSVGTLGSLALNFAVPSIVLEVENRGIAGGLNLGSVVSRARRSFSNTLIAGLMLIAAGFVGSAGFILCGVGVLISTAYSFAMQAWIVRSFELGSNAPTTD